MQEFTHSPRGLIHIDGKISKETDLAFVVLYGKGKITIKKRDLYNCHVRADRTIVLDVLAESYPRALARTQPGTVDSLSTVHNLVDKDLLQSPLPTYASIYIEERNKLPGNVGAKHFLPRTARPMRKMGKK